MDPVMRRVAGGIALLHPGPSLLVTGCFVAAAATAVPLQRAEALRLVLMMLPLQLCIGVSNDLFDLAGDRAAGRPKPLVTGDVPLRAAAVLALLLLLLGMGVATTLPPPTVGLAAIGVGAGLVYNIWLTGSAWSWLCWWVGLAVLPLCARAAVHAVNPAVLTAVPLAAGVALSTQLANALPDIDGDRAAGRSTIAVRLGAARTRRATLVIALATAALVVLFAGLGELRLVSGLAGALLYAGTAVSVSVLQPRRPFPAFALAAAGLATLWLLSLEPR